MSLLFAQFDPPKSEHVVDFLKMLFIAVPVILGVVVAWKAVTRKKEQQEITPQPLIIDQAEKYVTRAHCDLTHKETSRAIEVLDKQLVELRQERRQDIKDLHEKVNAVSREVSELKAATALQNQQLARMDQKLDRLAARA
ncbi:MAG TPA: hypothetical protein VG167_00975 [Verrucomicrobiae bacterium]|nr:hypothetical protein [Verrucomicrobiae bacterium]